MYSAYLERIHNLKRCPSITRGYWRAQLEFLTEYIGKGPEAKLLRHACKKLNINPLEVIEDIDSFYDSSAYITTSKERMFTKLNEKISKHIHTFNVNEFRIQYPVPDSSGNLTAHNLVIYNKRNAHRIVLTLKDGSDIVNVDMLSHIPFYRG